MGNNFQKIFKIEKKRAVLNFNKIIKKADNFPIDRGDLSKDTTVVHIPKIQRKLMAQNDREVPSSRLGEWVMEELRALDEVAYIRVASVYRQFQDIEEFKSEIDKLINK